MELYGKKIVIYGAGVSGLSAWQLVREHGGNAVIYDDNPQKAHATSSTRVFADCDMIVLSPGVPPSTPVVLDARLEGRQVISELELASSFCRAEQIAVTGTNGKTTTVMLIDAMLKAAGIRSYAVGNIGAAFSAVADRLDAVETAVVEASSFQLETSSRFAPDIAVMLNITPDHLDRHGNMERYAGAKARIFLNQSESDFAVYNADDERVTSLLPVVRAKRVPFSATRPVDGAYISSGFLCFRGKPVVEVADTDFAGREVENALAALAVAAIKDINFHTVAAMLTSFRRPEFRRKECGKVDGVRIFNDSKATNVYSVISAAERKEEFATLRLAGADPGKGAAYIASESLETGAVTFVAGFLCASLISMTSKGIGSIIGKYTFPEFFTTDSLLFAGVGSAIFMVANFLVNFVSFLLSGYRTLGTRQG